MRTRFYYLFVIVISLILSVFEPVNAYAAMPKGLDVSFEYAKDSSDTWAVVWLDIAEEYYTYAPTDVADDSIRPVVLSIDDAAGKVLPVRYPLGIERRDYYDISKVVQAYTGKTPIFVNMGTVKEGGSFEGMLSLLLCSAKHCLPVNIPISLIIPKSLPTLQNQKYFSLWQNSILRVQAEPLAMGLGGLSSLGSPVGLNAQNADANHYNWAFAPRIFAAELEVSSLDKALLLGFLAGIILNLMPCVFPVLTLKASSFLAARQAMDRASLGEFRIQNLLFAAGMLSLFSLLAIFLGTAGLIWGQFYQNTAFVVFMVVLIFLLALSMFGLFNIPIIDLKSGSIKSPRLQAYITGMITTILATPCSGPFLGGVLSWAFTQSLPVLVMVFVAVGLGMSLPYLLLALNPHWARLLPRPGAWMSIIERLVAFFLLGTALYLLTILPQDLHIPMLVGLIFVAFCGWIWGNFGGLNAPRLRRNFLSVGFVLCIALVIFYISKPPTLQIKWHEFEAASFEKELGKVPMLVEFTADWCPNCKFVEKTVLTTDFLDDIQGRYKVKLVRVDITRNNPQGEALLQALGSSSIPLTAIFNTGLKASAPIVLRDIYTQEMLEQALDQAF